MRPHTFTHAGEIIENGCVRVRVRVRGVRVGIMYILFPRIHLYLPPFALLSFFLLLFPWYSIDESYCTLSRVSYVVHMHAFFLITTLDTMA